MAGSDAERYEAVIAELRAMLVDRDAKVEALSAQVDQLTRLLEETRRAGKRQAAPFSKGDPTPDPKTPGRKGGKAYGKRAGRAVPERADRELDAALASSCPDCGGIVVEDGVHEQWVCEVPKCEPVVTRFRVHVGRCTGCARRVQGRHPEQASDALGAAGVQLGPRAKAVAQFLHYQLGLSFARCADALRRMFGLSSSRAALCRAAEVTGKALARPLEEKGCGFAADATRLVADLHVIGRRGCESIARLFRGSCSGCSSSKSGSSLMTGRAAVFIRAHEHHDAAC